MGIIELYKQYELKKAEERGMELGIEQGIDQSIRILLLKRHTVR